MSKLSSRISDVSADTDQNTTDIATNTSNIPATYEATIDLSTDPNAGEFLTGTLKCVRVGNLVAITLTTSMTHANDSNVASLAGLIPSDFRPATNVSSTVTHTSIAYTAVSFANGTFQILRFLADGSANAGTSSSGITISYAV